MTMTTERVRRISFRRTRPRMWQGNGMGTEPAHYAIERDGLEIGTIRPAAAYGWTASINGGTRINNDRLEPLKDAVRAHLFAKGNR